MIRDSDISSTSSQSDIDEQEYQNYDDNEEGSEQNSKNDDELEQEEKQIKEVLQNTKFETLLKLRKENTEIFKIKDDKKQAMKDEMKRKFQKKSKSAPMQRSSKIPISRHQDIFQVKKSQGRDPRFDNLSGKLNADLFDKSYAFLKEQKKQEIQELSRELNKKKYSQQEKNTLRNFQLQYQNEMSRDKQNQQKQALQQKHKKQQKEAALKGQQPYFKKKSQIKEELLFDKFQKLDKDGKIDNYLQSKRRLRDFKLEGTLENMEYKRKKFKS